MSLKNPCIENTARHRRWKGVGVHSLVISLPLNPSVELPQKPTRNKKTKQKRSRMKKLRVGGGGGGSRRQRKSWLQLITKTISMRPARALAYCLHRTSLWRGGKRGCEQTQDLLMWGENRTQASLYAASVCRTTRTFLLTAHCYFSRLMWSSK